MKNSCFILLCTIESLIFTEINSWLLKKKLKMQKYSVDLNSFFVKRKWKLIFCETFLKSHFLSIFIFAFYVHIENKMQTKMNVFKKKAIDCNLCPFSCFKNGMIGVRKNHKPNGWYVCMCSFHWTKCKYSIIYCDNKAAHMFSYHQ